MGKRLDRIVEPRQRGLDLGPRLNLVEPREMREQQPVGIAPPVADFLAVVEHRLLHPMHRPLGQRFFRDGARRKRGRIPQLRERGVTTPLAISRLPRDACAFAGERDIAVFGEVVEEPRFQLGLEDGAAVGGGLDAT